MWLRQTFTASSRAPATTDDFFESYRLYRGYCEHENSLIQQRMSLLLTIQTWLFGLSGFLMEGKAGQLTSSHVRPLLFVMAFVGLIASLSSLFAIAAAWSAQSALIKNWKHNPRVSTELRDAYPKLSAGGSRWAKWAGKALIAFPCLCAVAWVYWLWTLWQMKEAQPGPCPMPCPTSWFV